MAHEINNPLEAVGNLLYLAKLAGELSPPTRSYLEQAESQLERVSHITRQTLGFYRESAGPAEVSMSVIIDSVLRLYDNKLKNKGITVERDFDQAPPVHGLAGELRQMVANLVSNAVDALPANGKLAISVVRVSRNGTTGVELKVKDNGSGVPPENLERIFEPFFTTKADVGTGLGLWVTRQLAEHHGGTVEVESNTSGSEPGSLFTVFIPDASAAASISSGAAS
jgi:signal transduction histidine kinase